MPGWYNVKRLALGTEYYAAIPSNWKEEFERGDVLTLPTPLVFVCYSDVVLPGKGSVQTIWYMSITEYVVIDVLRILAAAPDGPVGVAFLDMQMGDHFCVVLIHFPSETRREVDDIGFLGIISSSNFDAVASLVISSGPPRFIGLE